LTNAEAEQAFEQAGQRVRARDYSTAAGLLEQVSKVAAVPVVFNDIYFIQVWSQTKTSGNYSLLVE
jgi:hypothetical protein